jgi:transketolase
MHRFGASAPIKDLLVQFGFTPEKVLEAARRQIERQSGRGACSERQQP